MLAGTSEETPFRPVVVAPTYNNVATLDGVMTRVRALRVPLVVVNDGSNDRTAQLLASSRWRDDSSVTVLTHPRNHGKAAALRSGFAAAAAAGYTHAATIDTDGQLDPEQIPDLLSLALANPRALVIGRRDEDLKGCPARSRLGRRLSNLFVWMESGVRVSDSQCGLRVYPLDFVLTAPYGSGRYGFETEIITRAGWAGRPVVETPVRCRYFPRDTAVSHFRPWVDSLRAVGMHARLMLRALLPFSGGTQSRHPRPRRLRQVLEWLNPTKAWRELRVDETARTTAAAGLAVGAFIANLPAYGLQTVLSLYFARRLHLHPLAVVAGSQLSMPPVGPALVAAAVTIGHLFLHGRLPALAAYRAAFAHGGFWPMLGSLFVEWTLGSLVVGLLSAVVTFAVASRLLRLTARDARRAEAEAAAPARGALDMA
jgi:uncharacterized protein (DUF2062 family)